MKLKQVKLWLLGILLLLIIAGSFCYQAGIFSPTSRAAAEATSGKAQTSGKPAPSQVAIVQSKAAHAEEIKYEEIKTMVKNAVELAGGFGNLIKEGSTVVLKPNLVVSADYTLPGWKGKPLAVEANGVTTDWRVTKAVVALIREINKTGKVYVMEGSGGGPPTDEIMKALNYTSESIPGVDEFIAIEKDSGAWQDFKSPGLVKVELPNGLLHKEYYLNKKYKEADVLISLPTLKNHWNAAVSGAIKNVGIGATPANIYGISPTNFGRNNMVDHNDPNGALHKWISDFFLCRPVDFVIMDGLQGIQNGPTPSYEISGTKDLAKDQMNMRLILAGKDAVALDTIESLVVGWDPESVLYLKYLSEKGAGNLDTANITVAGKQVSEVRKYFEGVKPVAGGSKITDKTAPTLKIKQVQIKNGMLDCSLEVGKDTRKVEVYIDNKLISPAITSKFSGFTLGLTDISAGKHTVTFRAYDRFLNCSEQLSTLDFPAISMKYGDYSAPQAKTAPIVDGLSGDACWANAAWADIKSLWLGTQPAPQDFSGRYKIVWTPEKLYYLVEITDNVLSDVHPDPLDNYYKDDTLELFLDEDRSGGDHANNNNAFAYHIAKDFNVVDLNSAGKPFLVKNGMEIKRSDSGNTYTWEISLPVYNDKYNEASASNSPVQLNASKQLGFAIAYCDNDGGNDRESFLGSIDIPGADKNVAWQNASVFGTLTLK